MTKSNRRNPNHCAALDAVKSGLKYYLVAVIGLVLIFSSSANAQWDVEYDEGEPHHFSIVTVGTHIVEGGEDDTAFTIGGDYEYRVSRLLGLGVVVEHAFGEIDATTLLAVADIHVWRGFAFQVGPGVEFADSESHAVGRIGALYEFKLEGDYTIAPQVHYDISKEDALVFGFAFGKAF